MGEEIEWPTKVTEVALEDLMVKTEEEERIIRREFGDGFEVTMIEHMNGGYEWSLESGEWVNGVEFLYKHRYATNQQRQRPMAPPPELVVGGPSLCGFYFRASKAGSFELEFIERRSFEPSSIPPIGRIKVRVEVQGKS